MQNQQNTSTDQHHPVFLPRREVERRVGLSRSTIYQRMADGKFPKPVQDLDSHSVWWLESEVTAWQRARIAARDRHGPGQAEPEYG